MNVIGDMLTELYRIFDLVNEHLFENELSYPVITIQKTKGNILGHFSCEPIWRDKTKVKNDNPQIDSNDKYAKYEINIDPRWFYKKNAADIVQVLIHECCHYWNKIHNIKEGNHNKKFKQTAERVGLECESGKGVGYGYTSLSDNLKEWVNDVVNPDVEVFKYYTATSSKPTKERRKKIFKYTCPQCDLEIKGKKDIEVKCVNCDQLMEMEEIEEDV